MYTERYRKYLHYFTHTKKFTSTQCIFNCNTLFSSHKKETADLSQRKQLQGQLQTSQSVSVYVTAVKLEDQYH
jgi:hypothetical protein